MASAYRKGVVHRANPSEEPMIEENAVAEQNLAEAPELEVQDAGTAAQSASAGETERAAQAEKEKPKDGNLQKRFNELTRRAEVAEAKADFFREQAIGKGEKKPDAETELPTAKEKPQADNFASYEEYVEALATFTADQRYEQRKAEETKQAEEATRKTKQQQAAEKWDAQAQTLIEKRADYKEIAGKALARLGELHTPGCDGVAWAANESEELGPSLLLYLGDNMEKIDELAAMLPEQAYRAMLRIEATLTGTQPGAGEKEPAPLTKAPKPPTPEKAGSKADDGELRDDLPLDEWQKRFDKRRAKHEKG